MEEATAPFASTSDEALPALAADSPAASGSSSLTPVSELGNAEDDDDDKGSTSISPDAERSETSSQQRRSGRSDPVRGAKSRGGTARPEVGLGDTSDRSIAAREEPTGRQLVGKLPGKVKAHPEAVEATAKGKRTKRSEPPKVQPDSSDSEADRAATQQNSSRLLRVPPSEERDALQPTLGTSDPSAGRPSSAHGDGPSADPCDPPGVGHATAKEARPLTTGTSHAGQPIEPDARAHRQREAGRKIKRPPSPSKASKRLRTLNPAEADQSGPAADSLAPSGKSAPKETQMKTSDSTDHKTKRTPIPALARSRADATGKRPAPGKPRPINSSSANSTKPATPIDSRTARSGAGDEPIAKTNQEFDLNNLSIWNTLFHKKPATASNATKPETSRSADHRAAQARYVRIPTLTTLT